MLKHFILGTAGHIDHGKTSLIKALTGTDTDRLKEEKDRGITIELGFAYLDLPCGQRVGIVDVPGHERFIKNMVAGATGIDIVAMIIAADEGIMPQTKEHLDICRLLNIQYGFIVLTKIDMVEEDWLDMVIEDIQNQMIGTFLEQEPILPVSSVTGKGIPQIVNYLNDLIQRIPLQSKPGIFRIPIDRIFSMKGFGTVITGSINAGEVQIGDTIMIYPRKIQAKVRGLQVHNQSIEKASDGMRTAINLQGIEKEKIQRGDIVAYPDTLMPSYMIDVHFHYLSSNSKSIKNRTQIRFHSGTSELLGYLYLLNEEELKPGEIAFAQIRVQQPVSLVKDDRYVVRSYSPIRTIGGGVVLQPIPVKHKRFKQDIIDGLHCIHKGNIEDIIVYHLNASDYHGIRYNQLLLMTNCSEKRLDGELHKLLSIKKILLVDKENRLYLHADQMDQLMQKALTFISDYHQKNQQKIGMPKEELKSKLPNKLNIKIFNLMIHQLDKTNRIVSERDTVRLFSHKPSLRKEQDDIKDMIIQLYGKTGLTPPTLKEVMDRFQMTKATIKDTLMYLVEQGELIKVKDDLFFDARVIHQLKQNLYDYLKKNNDINTMDFKQMTGVSRKFSIPLLEYFDSIRLTIRVGDSRKLLFIDDK